MKGKALVLLAIGMSVAGSLAFYLHVRRAESRREPDVQATLPSPTQTVQAQQNTTANDRHVRFAGEAQMMRHSQLPRDIRQLLESEYLDGVSYAVRRYDLNHDGQDEWIFSIAEEHTPDLVAEPISEGIRRTFVLARIGGRWQMILKGLRNENITLIESGHAGVYDDIEYSEERLMLTDPEGRVIGAPTNYVLRFRFSDGKYRPCQCHEVASGRVAPCAQLRREGSDTTFGELFELCAPQS